MYTVRDEMPGFQTAVRGNVELQVQQVARIDFELKIGAATSRL